jgi:hypothetical protein
MRLGTLAPAGYPSAWMATADINSPVSVKSATSAPMPMKAAAICAETEATNT